MRKVEKPSINDPQLAQYEGFETYKTAAIAHKKQIETEGRSTRTVNDHDFKFAKTALLAIYNHKCAFCEREITAKPAHQKADNAATIEHYRPKAAAQYYWLSLEWTNLFPSCKTCQKRGKGFETFVKIPKSVFDANHQFDITLFDAEKLNDLEQPKLLHPEYDEPKSFFYFDNKGKIQPIAGKNYERATYTITVLNLNNNSSDESVCALRRKILNNLKAKIKEQYLDYLKNNNVLLVLDTTLNQILIKYRDENTNFSLLYFYVLTDFETLISAPIASDIAGNTIEKSNIISHLNRAFLDFINA